MYKAYKFRLYPNDKQELLINKTFGCYRFIYNYFLDKCKNNGYQKAFDMCTKLKELYIKYPWLKEVDSCNLICNILQYKSREEGKYYYQVDKYYLSSKICSCFGK